MKAATKFQREIDSVREQVELVNALQAMSLRVERLESDRRIQALEAETASLKAKCEAMDRRDASAREIVFRAACSGIAVSPLLAAKLAEGEPVFAHADVLFPVKAFVGLEQAIDELRATDPALFIGQETIVVEPSDAEIEAHRRGRWGDVPDEG